MYGGGDDYGSDLRRQEEERQRNIDSGLTRIKAIYGGFTPEFYDTRKAAYQQFALPTAGKQFQQTRKSLTAALADRGLLRSGVKDQREASLNEEMNTVKRTVADAGQAEANALRTDVENSRSNMVAQLQASADPASVGNLALAQAATFRAPATFQPIGQLFKDWSDIYLTKLENDTWRKATDEGAALWPQWGGRGGSMRIVPGG